MRAHRAAEVGSITVVISNWETPDYTLRSAEALIGDGVPPERIVIVDNGSRDESAERLRDGLARCVVLRLEENVGYARAANHGARALPGSSYLLVNSDAFLERSGSVAKMLAALQDDTVGIVAPRVLNEDLTLQPTVMPTNSPSVALVRASGLSRLVPNRWQPRWSTHWDHATSREIAGADGAVLLVRGEAWEQLGGFDERMRMYAEDLDLCWRARKAGWRIWFVPEAEFVHIGGGATRKYWGSPRRAALIGESESRMIVRNLPPLSAKLTLAFIRAGLAVRCLAFGLARKREAAASLRAALRGYGAGLRSSDPDVNR